MEGLGAWVRSEGWPHRLMSLRRTSSRTDEALKGSQDRGQVGVTASKAQDVRVLRSYVCCVTAHALEGTYELLCIWYKGVSADLACGHQREWI